MEKITKEVVEKFLKEIRNDVKRVHGDQWCKNNGIIIGRSVNVFLRSGYAGSVKKYMREAPEKISVKYKKYYLTDRELEEIKLREDQVRLEEENDDENRL